MNADVEVTAFLLPYDWRGEQKAVEREEDGEEREDEARKGMGEGGKRDGREEGGREGMQSGTEVCRDGGGDEKRWSVMGAEEGEGRKGRGGIGASDGSGGRNVGGGRRPLSQGPEGSLVSSVWALKSNLARWM